MHLQSIQVSCLNYRTQLGFGDLQRLMRERLEISRSTFQFHYLFNKGFALHSRHSGSPSLLLAWRAIEELHL